MTHEMTQYWRAVQKTMPRILIFSLVVAMLAWFGVSSIGPTYQAHFSYLISLSEREAAGEYRFDGLYALQATDLFASTLAAWATTPEVIVSAYKKTGVELPSVDPGKLAGSIKATQTAPQLVEIVIKDSDRQVVEQLTQGLKQVMIKNVEDYHEQGIPAVAFRVVATEPWVGAKQLPRPVITVAVFLVTLVLSINLVLLRESWRNIK